MREGFVNLDMTALMALYLVNNSSRLLFYLLMLSLILKIPNNSFYIFFNFVSTECLLTKDYKHPVFFQNFPASALNLGTSMLSLHR